MGLELIRARTNARPRVATGSVSGPTTTSASYADLDDMTVTLTGLTVGSLIRADFNGQFSHSTAIQSGFFAFSIDGASEVGIRLYTWSGNNYSAPIALLHWFTATATSHTIKVRWRTDGGTLTASATARILSAEEYRV